VAGDRFAPHDEQQATTFEITTAVSTSALQQDQSGDPTPHSEEAQTAQFWCRLVAKHMPVNDAK